MIRKCDYWRYRSWFAWRPVRAAEFGTNETLEPKYHWVWFERIEKMRTPGLSRYQLPYTFLMDRRDRIRQSFEHRTETK